MMYSATYVHTALVLYTYPCNAHVFCAEPFQLWPTGVSGAGDEGSACMVTVEWTETSISCSAGSDTVSYTVGVCPYNQNCDEDRASAARNRVTVPVPRDSGVEHSFTVTAQICGGRVETTSPPQLVNLTGITCNVYLKSCHVCNLYNTLKLCMQCLIQKYREVCT